MCSGKKILFHRLMCLCWWCLISILLFSNVRIITTTSNGINWEFSMRLPYSLLVCCGGFTYWGNWEVWLWGGLQFYNIHAKFLENWSCGSKVETGDVNINTDRQHGCLMSLLCSVLRLNRNFRIRFVSQITYHQKNNISIMIPLCIHFIHNEKKT